MTKALYDLIGAERGAEREALRTSYTRTVAQLVRRRRALVEQGGDTRQLDLMRARADEAWAVLSDPTRRRRYDALLALTEGGDLHGGDLPRGEALWTQVVGSLASPAAAAAVDVVRAVTHLRVGQLPAPATTEPDRPTNVDALRASPLDTQADVPTQAAAAPAGRAMPELPSGPALRVVPSVPRPEPVAAQPPKVVPFQVTPSLGHRGPTPTPVFAQASVSPPPAAPRVQATPPSPPPGQVVRMPAQPMPVPTPPSAPTRQAPALDVDALVAEHGWSGDLLRAVREAKGMSLRDIGSATRISARYLDAIEQDDHSSLPSATFVKGYLREIARTLGLEEAALVQGYMRRME